MLVSFVPYRRGQRKFQLLLHLILSRFSANKIKNILCLQILLNANAFCKILQILNETDTETVVAIGAVHVRFVRAEVEVVRAVATAPSGRPIAAVVLHEAHISTAAAASSREEDRT